MEDETTPTPGDSETLPSDPEQARISDKIERVMRMVGRAPAMDPVALAAQAIDDATAPLRRMEALTAAARAAEDIGAFSQPNWLAAAAADAAAVGANVLPPGLGEIARPIDLVLEQAAILDQATKMALVANMATEPLVNFPYVRPEPYFVPMPARGRDSAVRELLSRISELEADNAGLRANLDAAQREIFDLKMQLRPRALENTFPLDNPDVPPDDSQFDQ